MEPARQPERKTNGENDLNDKGENGSGERKNQKEVFRTVESEPISSILIQPTCGYDQKDENENENGFGESAGPGNAGTMHNMNSPISSSSSSRRTDTLLRPNTIGTHEENEHDTSRDKLLHPRPADSCRFH